MAFLAAWDLLHSHYRANIWFGPMIVEHETSNISYPLPTDRPVCLREIRRERKQGKAVIEQHVVRIMCRVVADPAGR